MLGLGAIGQFAIGEVGGGAAEAIFPDKWWQQLSQPVRFPSRLPPGVQLFQAFNAQPFVSFSWFEPLAEPRIKTLPSLPTAVRPFFVTSPQPFVSFGWYGAISEPRVKTRPRLPPSQQPFVFPSPQPFVSFGWYGLLSDPRVKTKRGLRPSQQQFLAYHPRIMPNPNITGILNAVDAKDVPFFGGAQ